MAGSLYFPHFYLTLLFFYHYIYTPVYIGERLRNIIRMENTNARIHTLWQHKLCAVAAAVLFAFPVQAQLSLKRQKMDSIATRYGKEHAVYLENSRKMEVYEQGGQMLAKSTIIAERLYISDKSLNWANQDGIYGYNNTYVSSVGTNAYIPEGNDYKMERAFNNHGEITYTGLKKRSITRTSYVQEHEELRLLPGFEFGGGIPVLYSSFEVRAPRHVKMGFMLKGADTSYIKRSVKEEGGQIVYRFTAYNIPAIKGYEHTPNMRYYSTHVIPYVKSFRMTGARKDSVLSGSMESHGRTEYDYVHAINYKTDEFLTKKTKELIRGAYSDRDKVARIYNWVQNYFHYEALYDNERENFMPHQADTVCKRMYGDCKDMTSVLTAMYEKAGIESYCAVIGTDEKPYTHDDLPTSAMYNHMVAAVKLDGEWVFPDGTMHIQPLGANRPDIQGKEALILLDRTHTKVVKIPEEPASKNVLVRNTVMNLAYNDVTGTTYDRYSGYPAWNIGEALMDLNRKKEKDEFVRDLSKRGNNKFIVNNYNVDAQKTGNRDVTITTNFTLGDYVQQVKREYFVNMNLTNTFTELRMNEEDRNFPMYTKWKQTVRETVTLNVPKGYRVSYVPKAAKGGVDGLWSYKISYKVQGRSVVLTREYMLNTMKITPAQFKANNKLVDELKKLYKETVVLTAN